MSIQVSKKSAEEKDIVVKFPEVPHLAPYKAGDKFIIPLDLYNNNDVIQDEAMQLMDSIQKTQFGDITWSIKTENSGNGKVAVVFMIMN